jgi:hypothetical protein
MAVWALSKLSKDRFKLEKKAKLYREKDNYVREEWKEGIRK